MSLRIKNWKKYQHYSDRMPPWLKLYRRMKDSEVWVMTDDNTRACVSGLLMIASSEKDEHEGSIPTDPVHIQRILHLDSPPDLSKLLALDFIEVYGDDSKLLSSCATNMVRLYSESESETETDKSSSVTSKQVTKPPPPDIFIQMPVKEGSEPITDRDVAGWKDIYGRIDVETTVKHMVGYWKSLPRNKRKTRRGIRKSITSWLARDDHKAPVGSINTSQVTTKPLEL